MLATTPGVTTPATTGRSTYATKPPKQIASAKNLWALGSSPSSGQLSSPCASAGLVSAFASEEFENTNVSMNQAAQEAVARMVASMQRQYAWLKKERITEGKALRAPGGIIHTPHPIGNLDHQQTAAIDLAANGFGGLLERISMSEGNTYDNKKYKADKYQNPETLKLATKKYIAIADSFKLLDGEQLKNALTALSNATSIKEITDVIAQQQDALISNVVKQGIARDIIEIEPQQEAHDYIAAYIKERMEKRADMSQVRSWVGSDADGFVPFTMAYAYKVAGAVNDPAELNGMKLDEIAGLQKSEESTTFQYRTSYKAKKGAIGLEETLSSIRDSAQLDELTAADMTGSRFDKKYASFKKYMDTLTYSSPEACAAEQGTPERAEACKKNAMDTILRAVAAPGEEMVISDFNAKNTDGALQVMNTLLFIREAIPKWLEEKKEGKSADDISAIEDTISSVKKRAFLPLAESRDDMAAFTNFSEAMFGQYADAIKKANQQGRPKDAAALKAIIVRDKNLSMLPFFGPSDLTDDVGAESITTIPKQYLGVVNAVEEYEPVFGPSEPQMQYGQGTADRRGSGVFYKDAKRVTRQGNKINTNALKVGGLSAEDPGYVLSPAISEQAIDTHQRFWREEASDNKPKGTMTALWDALVAENPDIFKPLDGKYINNSGCRVKEGVLSFSEQRAIPRANIATFLGGMTATRFPVNLEDGSIDKAAEDEITGGLIHNPQAMLQEIRQIAAVDTKRMERIGKQGNRETQEIAEQAVTQTNLYTKASARLIGKAIGLEPKDAATCDTNEGRRAFANDALEALLGDERLSKRSRSAAAFLLADLTEVIERSNLITEEFQKIVDIKKESDTPNQDNLNGRISSLALIIDNAANAPVPIFVVNAAMPKKKEATSCSFQEKLEETRTATPLVPSI